MSGEITLRRKFVLLLLISFTHVSLSQPQNPPSTGGNSERLVNLVNTYRANNSVAAIPISRALMHVGQRHADAIATNESVITQSCNPFSWPSAPANVGYTWQPCCYSSSNDAKSLACMNEKAAEITSGWSIPYNSSDRETFGQLTGFFSDPEQELLDLWVGSADIRTMLLDQEYEAIGVGISQNGNQTYAYLVVGTAADPNTWTSNSPPTPTPTPNDTTTSTPISTPTPLTPMTPGETIDPLLPGGGDPETLVQLVNQYRVSQGKSNLTISKALMYTGQYHANAQLRSPANTTQCTIFSWPKPITTGTWQECCLPANNTNVPCMQAKPREITLYWGQPFFGDGYEFSASLTGNFSTPEQIILSLWTNNANGKAFLLNTGIWAPLTWKAIGAGIAKVNESTQAYLWFSTTTDTNTWNGQFIPVPPNTSNTTTPTSNPLTPPPNTTTPTSNPLTPPPNTTTLTLNPVAEAISPTPSSTSSLSIMSILLLVPFFLLLSL